MLTEDEGKVPFINIGTPSAAASERAVVFPDKDSPFPASGSKTSSSGQRWLLPACGAASAFVVPTNIVLLAYALIHSPSTDGYPTLLKASCARSKLFVSAFQLLINVLSTILLSASTISMQRLMAPSRQEIDAAHARFKSLDIGIPSIRNFFAIKKRRAALWCLLGFSSLPLHFVYNSSVFVQLSTNDYIVRLSNEAGFQWVQGLPDPPTLDAAAVYPGLLTSSPVILANESSAVMGDLPIKAKRMVRLTPKQCIDAYANNLVPNFRDLVLISTDIPDNVAIQEVGNSFGDAQTYGWMCPDETTCFKSTVNPGNWSVEGYTVDYCMAEPIPEVCSVRLFPAFLGSVIGAAVVKTVCILVMVAKIPLSPIRCAGDAIASFLLQPDPYTEGRATFGMTKFSKKKIWRSDPLPQELPPQRRFLKWRTISWPLFLMTVISWMGFGGVFVGFFAAIGDPFTGYFSGNMKELGWGDNGDGGQSSQNNLFTVWAGNSFVYPVLTANSPQIPLSFIYVTTHVILAIWASHSRYMRYATSYFPLEVSTARKGEQMATYLLGLPVSLAITLTVSSAMLHYLGSQAMYFNYVYYFHNDGVVYSSTLGDDFTPGGQGVSLEACIAVFVVGGALALGVLVLGFMRLPNTKMPLGATNSAAISAACHPSVRDQGAEFRKVRWGEFVGSGHQWSSVATQDEHVGHLGFTSLTIREPVLGKLYA